jgi:hypothetical protein
VEEVPELSAES